ncbi:hypothetical protein B0H11DRAFT_2204860 [Mycena galericulata]|nr:hypothetical protein B0H11DRAFT_2204860 [Mycena galericulata]
MPHGKLMGWGGALSSGTLSGVNIITQEPNHSGESVPPPEPEPAVPAPEELEDPIEVVVGEVAVDEEGAMDEGKSAYNDTTVRSVKVYQVVGLARRVHDSATLQDKFEKLLKANDDDDYGKKVALDRRVPTRWSSDLTCLAAHILFKTPVIQGMMARIEKRWAALDQPFFVLSLVLNPYESLARFGDKAGINVFFIAFVPGQQIVPGGSLIRYHHHLHLSHARSLAAWGSKGGRQWPMGQGWVHSQGSKPKGDLPTRVAYELHRIVAEGAYEPKYDSLRAKCHIRHFYSSTQPLLSNLAWWNTSGLFKAAYALTLGKCRKMLASPCRIRRGLG